MAGLCPDPLGELTALPRPSWILGGLLLMEGKGEKGGKRGEGEREGKERVCHGAQQPLTPSSAYA